MLTGAARGRRLRKASRRSHARGIGLDVLGHLSLWLRLAQVSWAFPGVRDQPG